MAFIASSTTVYAKAYLTELGRQYLFDSPNKPRYKTLDDGTSIDQLKIERFSFHDSSIDYNVADLPVSGDIIDVTGESENTITGAKGRTLFDFISPGDTNLPKEDITLVEYKTTQKDIVFDLKLALDKLKTVVTQQLILNIDGEIVNEGAFVVTPTNYGKNNVANGELVLTLKEPTLAEDGYRLRIFYPTTGQNNNKMTFQFEKASAQKAVVTKVVNTIVTPTTTATATLSNTSTTIGG